MIILNMPIKCTQATGFLSSVASVLSPVIVRWLNHWFFNEFLSVICTYELRCSQETCDCNRFCVQRRDDDTWEQLEDTIYQRFSKVSTNAAVLMNWKNISHHLFHSQFKLEHSAETENVTFCL